jgi:hypothetical protein
MTDADREMLPVAQPPAEPVALQIHQTHYPNCSHKSFSRLGYEFCKTIPRNTHIFCKTHVNDVFCRGTTDGQPCTLTVQRKIESADVFCVFHKKVNHITSVLNSPFTHSVEVSLLPLPPSKRSRRNESFIQWLTIPAIKSLKYWVQPKCSISLPMTNLSAIMEFKRLDIPKDTQNLISDRYGGFSFAKFESISNANTTWYFRLDKCCKSRYPANAVLRTSESVAYLQLDAFVVPDPASASVLLSAIIYFAERWESKVDESKQHGSFVISPTKEYGPSFKEFLKALKAQHILTYNADKDFVYTFKKDK